MSTAQRVVAVLENSLLGRSSDLPKLNSYREWYFAFRVCFLGSSTNEPIHIYTIYIIFIFILILEGEEWTYLI